MRALALALALAAPPAPAPGPKVSLNGINIDGVANQRFENCTVTIDASGNVNIEAKGYTVRPAGGGAAPALKAVPLAPAPPPASPPAAGPAAPAAPEKLSRRYFLVTEQTRPDGTQFDIAVFINAKWIRELKSQEGQVVAEVTRYLRLGPNKVTLAATKRPGERKSTSPDVVYRVVIGEGDQGGDHVRIDSPMVDARRTAAEAGDVTEEFTLVAR
ncbi:MAG TPA: hypothetical protein VFI16_09540 [Anaeromyxobacteraceae bacterium]|nr:hypothetical protein [Anaeromyxobacteraceae bacterium]